MSESDGAAGVGRAAVKVRTSHKDVEKRGAAAFRKSDVAMGKVLTTGMFWRRGHSACRLISR